MPQSMGSVVWVFGGKSYLTGPTGGWTRSNVTYAHSDPPGKMGCPLIKSYCPPVLPAHRWSMIETSSCSSQSLREARTLAGMSWS